MRFMARFKVNYRCHRCTSIFDVFQGDPELDEDITLCWDCIDEILPPRMK